VSYDGTPLRIQLSIAHAEARRRAAMPQPQPAVEVWHREYSHADARAVVQPEVWQAADAALRVAREMLDLPEGTSLRWLRPATAAEVETAEADPYAKDPTQPHGRRWRKAPSGSSGLFLDLTCPVGNFVFVYVTHDPVQAATAAAHELRHLWQSQRWRMEDSGPALELLERDAEQFATAVVGGLRAHAVVAGLRERGEL
jgi:hypothetical protein